MGPSLTRRAGDQSLPSIDFTTSEASPFLSQRGSSAPWCPCSSVTSGNINCLVITPICWGCVSKSFYSLWDIGRNWVAGSCIAGIINGLCSTLGEHPSYGHTRLCRCYPFLFAFSVCSGLENGKIKPKKFKYQLNLKGVSVYDRWICVVYWPNWILLGLKVQTGSFQVKISNGIHIYLEYIYFSRESDRTERRLNCLCC